LREKQHHASNRCGQFSLVPRRFGVVSGKSTIPAKTTITVSCVEGNFGRSICGTASRGVHKSVPSSGSGDLPLSGKKRVSCGHCRAASGCEAVIGGSNLRRAFATNVPGAIVAPEPVRARLHRPTISGLAPVGVCYELLPEGSCSRSATTVLQGPNADWPRPTSRSASLANRHGAWRRHHRWMDRSSLDLERRLPVTLLPDRERVSRPRPWLEPSSRDCAVVARETEAADYGEAV